MRNLPYRRSTGELQQAYDNWGKHVEFRDFDEFWSFVKMDKAGQYFPNFDAWLLSQESESLIRMLLSPHYKTLLKIWTIRQASKEEHND